MAHPVHLSEGALGAGRRMAWGLSAALLVALTGLTLADMQRDPTTAGRLAGALAVVLFVGGAGVVLWQYRGAQGRARAVADALLVAFAAGVAAGLRHFVGPSWPAGMVLATGVTCMLTVRSGALVARSGALALALGEMLPLLALPPSVLPSGLGLACAVAAVPLLLEAFTQRWRAGLQTAVTAAVDARMRAVDQDAQDYRLIASGTAPDLPHAVREVRRAAGSVDAIRETRYELLELLARVYQPHSAILFKLDSDGSSVRVEELVTRSDFVVTGALAADKGVINTVLRKRAPLMLHHVSDGFGGVTWYHPPTPTGALAAVPVTEGEHLRGVLVLDWLVPRTLTDNDAAVLGGFARQMVRVARNEQLFAMLDREKVQADNLFAASHAFIGTLRMTDTYATALSTARQLSDASQAALVLASEQGLRLAAVDGLPTEWTGRPVEDPTGLLRRCLSTMEVLPASGSGDGEQCRVLLGEALPLNGAASIRLAPLEENGAAWGVLVLAAPKRGAFGWLLEDRLKTVATLASLAVANRRMYDHMERMATTDGLTGLLNHRTFQERCADALKRSARYGRPCSLFLTDIDHFKNVNDTYGHPVGDEVIRRVSAVLASHARTTDVVARYGGEEFACVMEETDAPGAMLLADRVREAVQREIVKSDMGPLSVTLSLGVAQYPLHGTTKQQLIERADQALYAAKHGGRNRCVMAQPPDEGRSPALAEKA